jgi:shikimate kinase
MKKNIAMIGMPASGKSAIGRMVAKELGMRQVDGDTLIEEHEGMTLQQIINAHGNDYFKKLEEEILSTVDLDNIVLSPGGSVCYYEKVMKHLSEIAEVVYLKVSYKELLYRVKKAYKKRHPDNPDASMDEIISARGIVIQPGMTFRDLYNERTPLYEKYAGLTIDTTKYSKEESTRHLLELLREL